MDMIGAISFILRVVLAITLTEKRQSRFTTWVRASFYCQASSRIGSRAVRDWKLRIWAIKKIAVHKEADIRVFHGGVELQTAMNIGCTMILRMHSSAASAEKFDTVSTSYKFP